MVGIFGYNFSASEMRKEYSNVEMNGSCSRWTQLAGAVKYTAKKVANVALCLCLVALSAEYLSFSGTNSQFFKFFTNIAENETTIPFVTLGLYASFKIKSKLMKVSNFAYKIFSSPKTELLLRSLAASANFIQLMILKTPQFSSVLNGINNDDKFPLKAMIFFYVMGDLIMNTYKGVQNYKLLKSIPSVETNNHDTSQQQILREKEWIHIAYDSKAPLAFRVAQTCYNISIYSMSYWFISKILGVTSEYLERREQTRQSEEKKNAIAMLYRLGKSGTSLDSLPFFNESFGSSSCTNSILPSKNLTCPLELDFEHQLHAIYRKQVYTLTQNQIGRSGSSILYNEHGLPFAVIKERGYALEAIARAVLGSREQQMVPRMVQINSTNAYAIEYIHSNLIGNDMSRGMLSSLDELIVSDNGLLSAAQVMSILDHTLQNGDRHLGNFLLTPKRGLMAIDHDRILSYNGSSPFTDLDLDGKVANSELTMRAIEWISSIDLDLVKRTVHDVAINGSIKHLSYVVSKNLTQVEENPEELYREYTSSSVIQFLVHNLMALKFTLGKLNPAKPPTLLDFCTVYAENVKMRMPA